MIPPKTHIQLYVCIIDIHAAGMNMDGPFVIEPVSLIHRDLKEEKIIKRDQ